MKRNFEIEGHRLGEGEAKKVFTHDVLGWRRSYAFLCPFCGRVWARASLPNQVFLAWHKSCGDCPPYLPDDIPGSLWIPGEAEFLASWPEAVWRRELSLLLNAAQTERQEAA